MALGIRELAERAKAVGAIDLAQGIVQIDPPSALVAELHQLAAGVGTTYDNKRGVGGYREAVVDWLGGRGWDVDVANVQGTAGVTCAITSALLAKLSPGDQVLLPEPFFIGHKLLLEALGFVPVYYSVPLETEPDWKEIGSQFASVQACIITSPANPTGQCASAETVRELSQAATSSGCLLLIDEIYREFHWDEIDIDDTHYRDIDLTATCIARSFSKTLSIPGWRVGYSISSPENVEHFSSLHDPVYLGGVGSSQQALAEALMNQRGALEVHIQAVREQLQESRRLLVEAAEARGWKPLATPGAYYLVVHTPGEDDMAVCEALLESGVAATPLRVLYADTSVPREYIRLHFAVSPEIAAAAAAKITDR